MAPWPPVVLVGFSVSFWGILSVRGSVEIGSGSELKSLVGDVDEGMMRQNSTLYGAGCKDAAQRLRGKKLLCSPLDK
jgi:hypothetical protein